jgi:hypothetical protein
MCNCNYKNHIKDLSQKVKKILTLRLRNDKIYKIGNTENAEIG